MNVGDIISSISLITWRRRFALWAAKGAPLTDLVELDDAPKDNDISRLGIRDFSISLMSWIKSAPSRLPTPVLGWQRRRSITQLLVGVGGEKLLEKDEWLEIIKEEINDEYGITIGLKQSTQQKRKAEKSIELSKLMDVTLKAEESLDRAFIYPYHLLESDKVAIGEVVVELVLNAIDIEAGPIHRLDAHELIHLTNETWEQVPFVRLAESDDMLMRLSKVNLWEYGMIHQLNYC